MNFLEKLQTGYVHSRRIRILVDHLAILCLGLYIGESKTNLGLYPWLTSLVCGRSLHFVTRLELSSVKSSGD